MKSPAQTIDVEVLPPENKAAAGTTAPERSVDQWLALLAWVMDDFFRVPGTNRRFGLDPLIGILPGVGDGATGLLSACTILRGAQRGVPKIVLTRMVLNIFLDSGIGAIPFLGDAFSFWFKSFARNQALLTKHGGDADQPRASTLGDKLFVWSLIALAVAIPVAAILLTATLFYKLLSLILG